MSNRVTSHIPSPRRYGCATWHNLPGKEAPCFRPACAQTLSCKASGHWLGSRCLCQERPVTWVYTEADGASGVGHGALLKGKSAQSSRLLCGGKPGQGQPTTQAGRASDRSTAMSEMTRLQWHRHQRLAGPCGRCHSHSNPHFGG